MTTECPEYEEISREFIEDVCSRLADNKPVRRKLPGGGRLNIDRQLPFLCVYRRDPKRSDAGTDLFVHAEASFLSAPGNAPVRKGLRLLIRRIAETAAERLGGFLLLEIWSGPDTNPRVRTDPDTQELLLPPPSFTIVTRPNSGADATVASLEFALQRVKLHRQAAAVTLQQHTRNHPPRMLQLISAADADKLKCDVIGLEIDPVFRDPATGQPFPHVLRTLRRGVGRALKRAFFAFALKRTNVRPQHYFALGRKSLAKLVWDVDRQLTDVSSQFKFLLQLTPINAERSWQEFSASGFQSIPHFQYRPLDADPLLLKRQLLQVPTEQIEDPTLSHLMRQTQDELDRQLNMLADIDTPRFLPGSLQVFGGVEAELLSLAEQMLQTPARNSRRQPSEINATEFARLATREMRKYRAQSKAFTAKAIVREDMYAGLLCAGGNLLIGRQTMISADRAEALIAHEVGTHLVTYYNGKCQPMGLLRVGLAGYDGLQEGMAVLSEYLVGGLNASRLRLLAARVLATHRMIAGQPLPDIFRQLTEDYGLERRPAYTVVLRVHRGGGLTKDAVYLRGLVEILRYLGRGGKLEPLLVGKIAADHIPIIDELQHRGVLQPAAIRPHYLQDKNTAERLEQLRSGNYSVLDLMRQSE